MNYEYYRELSVSNDFEVYDFVSSGFRGEIVKRVRFDCVDEHHTYNLAFGDLIDDGEIDDYSISDNKDMTKILATLATIVRIFLDKYPERHVVFRGSTKERTRLYRMAIGNNLDELQYSFVIYGLGYDEGAQIFTRNKEYFAFLVRKKL